MGGVCRSLVARFVLSLFASLHTRLHARLHTHLVVILCAHTTPHTTHIARTHVPRCASRTHTTHAPRYVYTHAPHTTLRTTYGDPHTHAPHHAPCVRTVLRAQWYDVRVCGVLSASGLPAPTVHRAPVLRALCTTLREERLCVSTMCKVFDYCARTHHVPHTTHEHIAQSVRYSALCVVSYA